MTQRLLLWLKLALALLCIWASLSPAAAAVRITFWSREFGNYFPHAFYTLDGTPDAGGPAVHLNYGFTARSISPAILMGTVGGRIDVAKPAYIAGSNAHFTLDLSDAQYAAVRALADEWGEKGDSRYNLNRRNCVHFVAEAMRRAGLAVVEPKELMKKPRSFTQSVGRLNPGRVTTLELSAPAYYQRFGNPPSGALAAPAAAPPVMVLPPDQQPGRVR